MKIVCRPVVVVLFLLSLNAEGEESHAPFKITGEYLTPSATDSSTEISASEDDTTSTTDTEIGWPAASVVITHEISTDEGDTEVIELASGQFVDGKVELSGEITEPTSVIITAIRNSGEESLTMRTLVVPGKEDIEFAIVDRKVAYRPARLVLVGTSDRVRNPEKKFTIKGDFRSMEKELSLGVVTVSGPGLNDQGELSRVNHGTVLLDEGKFIIESEIHEPSVLFVSASAGENAFNEYFGRIDIVVEAGSEIVISPEGWSRELVATAENGRHHKLVHSWQQGKKYQTLLRTYATSYKDFRDAWEARWRAQQAAKNTSQETETDQDSSPEEATSNAQREEESDTEEETGQVQVTDQIEPVLAFSNGKPAVDECVHVELADSDGELDAKASTDNPEYHKLFLELVNLRLEALEEIASRTPEPIDKLLAMELGAFGYDSKNIKKSVSVYDNIATMLDKDLVARRVTPARKEIADFIEVNEIDENLVPGQIAPDFTLPTLEGINVNLHELVEEHDIVLVDFWASWCGPCIAAFPHLKELYASYTDRGFEILSVSLDSAQEDWVEASAEQNLPWIDVGDIAKPEEGIVGRAYGVISIPKSFLLDEQGCIHHKNLSTEELERVLQAKYD